MRTASVALLLALAVGCGLGRTPAPPPETRAAVRTELYFGRAGTGGDVVDDAEWAAFLTEVVTPRFPDGFTVIDAAGQYREGPGSEVTRERSEVLVLVHDADGRTEGALREVVETYKRRFGQRAVLRVDTTATVGF